MKSAAVEQVVACASVTQRAGVRSPVGTSFLREVFRGFSSPVRRMSGSFRPIRSPNIIWLSSSSSIIISLRAPMRCRRALKPQIYIPGMNMCGSFPLHSAPHSLFNICTDLKRSEKIPGAPTWRWGEWIWITGPYRLHRNSLQGLNISSIRVFDQIRDPEIPITLS